MRNRSRQFRWALGLSGVALLPIGIALAVVAAFAKGEPLPPAPKVVAGWASGPMEVRVAFDRAVDPVVAAHSVGHQIRFGEATNQPPGMGRPGGDGGAIRIAAARLIDAGRTLLLVTDPHPRETTYSLRLDEIKSPGNPKEGQSQVVTYSLAGLEAKWTPAGGDKPDWSGWWPDLDPAAVRALLAGSAEHDQLWDLTKKPGKLELRSFVAIPAGKIRSVIDADALFEATLGSESTRSDAAGRAAFNAETTAEPTELTLTLTTPSTRPDLTLHWAIALVDSPNSTAQALPPAAYGVAWAPPAVPPAAPPTIPPFLETGGDPARGAIVFASEQAKCSTCHQVRGQGGQVGPDLSNLIGVSRAWVYQNIVEPNAAIHPDYMSSTIAFKDGRVNMGVVRAEGADAIRVGGMDAQIVKFPRHEVEEIRPSTASIMPVGLLGTLGDDKTRDLLAYLTGPNPEITPGNTNPRK